MTTYKCSVIKCSNQIEIGCWCDECGHQFLEDVMLMSTPPSFFYNFYDFIATKIDNIIFRIEYIHDRKQFRKKKHKNSVRKVS